LEGTVQDPETQFSAQRESIRVVEREMDSPLEHTLDSSDLLESIILCAYTHTYIQVKQIEFNINAEN
jgi:hypothetical protein